MRLPVITALLLPMLLAIGDISPSIAQAEDEFLTGKVIEVKGVYCKIDLAGDCGLKVGDTGEAGSLSLAPSRVEVFGLRAEYIVGKTSDGAIKVGDEVSFKKSDSATTPGTPPSTPSGGEPSSPALAEAAIDSQLVLVLTGGKEIRGLTLKAVEHEDGVVTSLRMFDEQRKRATNFATTRLLEALRDGEVVYESHQGELAVELAALRKARAERIAKEKADREAWIKDLATRGIRPWKEVTDELQKERLEQHQEFISRVSRNYPGMKLYETEHFLFNTNMPPNQVAPYVTSLDAMHDLLVKTFGLPEDKRVFAGKALVFAFVDQREFAAFEATFMNRTVTPGVYGLCHSRSDGDVIIGCYRGDDPNDFGQMLVHETSHGFVHRLFTPVHFPSWVNEGMAEWIGAKLVPDSRAVNRKEAAALMQLQRQPSLGGNFFQTTGNIESWQYGVASSMAKFMIKTNPEAYVQFVKALKDGKDPETALKESYDATYQQLTTAYGRAIGVPNLVP